MQSEVFRKADDRYLHIQVSSLQVETIDLKSQKITLEGFPSFLIQKFVQHLDDLTEREYFLTRAMIGKRVCVPNHRTDRLPAPDSDTIQSIVLL